MSAFVATAFAQDDAGAASAQWRLVAEQLQDQGAQACRHHGRGRARRPRLHDLPQGASQQAPLHYPVEHLHAEIKRRTRVVGIFPNENAITRPIGAGLLEQNDEWAVARRYMTLESIAPVSQNLTGKLPAMAA